MQIQFILSDFLQAKKRAHGIYEIIRSETLFVNVFETINLVDKNIQLFACIQNSVFCFSCCFFYMFVM